MKLPRLAVAFICLVSGGISAVAPAASSPAGESAPWPAWLGDADQLIDYPKPNPEKAFAEVKVLQPDGSACRTPREDWEGARQRIATDPAWADWVAKQRTAADAWMARDRDRPEWEAGWTHEFISPTDGAFIVWTEDVPGEDVKFLTSLSGERVEITPTLFRSWVGSFRKKHADKLGEVAQLFRLTGDVRYAEWVAGQLDFYADHYQGWGKGVAQRKNSYLGYQSLDDAMLVSRYAEAARLIFDWVAPERRKAWFDHLFNPEVELLDRSYQAVHNIALWQHAAQAQVALLYGDEAMWSRVVDGKYGVRAQFRRGVTSDYFWYEQSMDYNSFVARAVQPLLMCAAMMGEGGRLRHEAAIVENLMLAPFTLCFPDGTLPNPADATKISRAPVEMLAQIYRILPTFPGLARAGAVKSWDTLIDPPSAISSVTSEVLPEVVSHSFESTRFALLKQGPWQVFFHYGQVNVSHSQAEALNWSASFEGVDISHDPGTVGYGSPMAGGYYRLGLNHNVPLVGGEGEKPWRPGTLLLFDAEKAIVSAAQPEYRSDASARRTLRIEGDALVDEATVTLTDVAGGGTTTPKLGLALHLQGKPRLSKAFHEVSEKDFVAGRQAAFKYWKDVRAATFKDRAEIEVEFAGGRVLTVEFATPGEFTLYQGSSPDVPPGRRAGFYLEKTDAVREATFVTTLKPAAAP